MTLGPIGLTPIEQGRTYLLRVERATPAQMADLRAQLDELGAETGARFRVLVGVDFLGTADRAVVDEIERLAAALYEATHPDAYIWTNPLTGETANLAPWDITRVNATPPTTLDPDVRPSARTVNQARRAAGLPHYPDHTHLRRRY